jgi:hypothetical protein
LRRSNPGATTCAAPAIRTVVLRPLDCFPPRELAVAMTDRELAHLFLRVGLDEIHAPRTPFQRDARALLSSDCAACGTRARPAVRRSRWIGSTPLPWRERASRKSLRKMTPVLRSPRSRRPDVRPAMRVLVERRISFCSGHIPDDCLGPTPRGQSPGPLTLPLPAKRRGEGTAGRGSWLTPRNASSSAPATVRPSAPPLPASLRGEVR